MWQKRLSSDLNSNDFSIDNPHARMLDMEASQRCALVNSMICLSVAHLHPLAFRSLLGHACVQRVGGLVEHLIAFYHSGNEVRKTSCIAYLTGCLDCEIVFIFSSLLFIMYYTLHDALLLVAA